MSMPPTSGPVRRGLAALAAATCLAAPASAPLARGGEEPGPVPLLRDAVPVHPEPAVGRRPAGLGDWRLVAALGATFMVLLGARFASVRRAPPPPPDVFEVLGTASLGGHHAVRIVRFGPKTLLVGVSAAGATTLAELADPQATACIAAACRGVERSSRKPIGRAASPAVHPRGVAAEDAA